MQDLIRQLLAELGEDPTAKACVDTPKRVEKAFKFLTSGYDADIDRVLNNALFTVDYSEMVIVKDIDFYSLCEHHLLPFFGKCHVAYIPSTKVIGLSKIPRLVDVFARRLQVQERLTNQIAETIRDKIAPLGVAVVWKRRISACRCEAWRSRIRLRDERHARRLSQQCADAHGVPRARSSCETPCLACRVRRLRLRGRRVNLKGLGRRAPGLVLSPLPLSSTSSLPRRGRVSGEAGPT